MKIRCTSGENFIQMESILLKYPFIKNLKQNKGFCGQKQVYFIPSSFGSKIFYTMLIKGYLPNLKIRVVARFVTECLYRAECFNLEGLIRTLKIKIRS